MINDTWASKHDSSSQDVSQSLTGINVSFLQPQQPKHDIHCRTNCRHCCGSPGCITTSHTLLSCLCVFSWSSNTAFIHLWSPVDPDASSRLQFIGESCWCAERITVNIVGMFFSCAVEKCCANEKNRRIVD